MKIACRSCLFYHVDKMECRHAPPVMHSISIEAPSTIVGAKPAEVQVKFMAVWPRVSADMWCGAHRTESGSAFDPRG